MVVLVDDFYWLVQLLVPGDVHVSEAFGFQQVFWEWWVDEVGDCELRLTLHDGVAYFFCGRFGEHIYEHCECCFVVTGVADE